MRAERQIQTPAALAPPFSTPRYSLRQHLGQWLLTFEGRHARLKHQQGMAYVAYLLIHPPKEPLHALALALRAQDNAAAASPTPPPGPCQPSTGKTIPVGGQARPDPFELQLAEAREAWAI